MESKFWEPVKELEFMALDEMSCPMNADTSPEDYGCTVVGFDLADPEGCHSILTISGFSDRAEDEEFAKLIIKGLFNLARSDETAWLIEIATDMGAKWYTVNSNFTADPHESLRFSRKEDVEAIIPMLGLQELGAFATEHIWSA